MGLIINSTAEKKILISGTDIELPNIYGRIEFAGRIDGITLDVSMYTFASKQAFTENKMIYTDVRNDAFSIKLNLGESQDINTALNYAKVAYEDLGYNVEIDG